MIQPTSQIGQLARPDGVGMSRRCGGVARSLVVAAASNAAPPTLAPQPLSRGQRPLGASRLLIARARPSHGSHGHGHGGSWHGSSSSSGSGGSGSGSGGYSWQQQQQAQPQQQQSDGPSWSQGGSSFWGGSSQSPDSAAARTEGSGSPVAGGSAAGAQASGGGGGGNVASGGGGGGGALVPGFLAALPGFGRERTRVGASVAARLRANATGGSGSGSGSDSAAGGGGGWSFRPSAHADGGAVAAWAAAALAPVAVWALTWALTAGLAHLADAAIGGMAGVARALYPTLPVRGVGHEDVAASLVKSLRAGTVDPDTWARPGLLVPGFLLRGLMRAFYAIAAGSTAIAGSLAGVGPWMAACALSQAALCALCLLLALPGGSGLQALVERAKGLLPGGKAAAAAAEEEERPGTSAFSWNSGGGGSASSSSQQQQAGAAALLPFEASSSTALTLKLAATLAWPCISVGAVGAAVAARAPQSPPLLVALLHIVAAGLAVASALTIGLAAARYAREIGLGHAGDAAAVDFGLQAGVLCAAQAGVNGLQLLAALCGGGLAFRDFAFAALSTAVLARVALTVWALRGEARPTAWLQLLTLDTLLSRDGPGRPATA